jgi:hypothetical protein
MIIRNFRYRLNRKVAFFGENMKITGIYFLMGQCEDLLDLNLTLTFTIFRERVCSEKNLSFGTGAKYSL